MEGLANKIFVVTGASSGIGLSTAKILLDSRAKVFGCDIAPEPEALSSLENFSFLQCDLTEPNIPAKVAEKCVQAFGKRIDGLLNIAGIMDSYNSVDTLEDAAWDRNIAINLTAPVKLMRSIVPIMKESGGGSIVNVSSKAGLSGAVTGVAYTAAKHGLIGATKQVAFRFRNDHIRCNAVCPGGVMTAITDSIDMSKVDQASLAVLKGAHDLSVIPGRNRATPESIANIIVFLASDLSSEISGAIISADSAWCTI
ncbi:uncharacterized protein A1O5_03716 [Cladophialophora psammophila CBS 110553]|uniref:3-oxoacyl-[acyl-carrier protein] reductase n=1 Tax=Cladophialophora psammophila CBS 110553 TaxID=1182543 RepID=W9X5H0_9EURO|nr:uncharacterized protein A1O5_03716 [Cladophialophora psammophila CBS 110553]EXJ72570.1 hypothetical protein A1O5_03716 [Cladophialophora psammophila CBS 110553]